LGLPPYVDRGYRGHGAEAEGRKIFISRQKRGITPTIRRELRRRAAIEPVIGHMKTDGHLGRNFLPKSAVDNFCSGKDLSFEEDSRH
jgi:hypothetical protein